MASPKADGSYESRSWLVNRDGGSFAGRFEDGAFICGMKTPRMTLTKQ